MISLVTKVVKKLTLSAHVETCQTTNRHVISKNSHPIRLVDDVTNQNISLSACDEVIAILTLEQ